MKKISLSYLSVITILGLLLHGCTPVQDDIELIDAALQEEEKLYHAYEARSSDGTSRIIKTNKPVLRPK